MARHSADRSSPVLHFGPRILHSFFTLLHPFKGEGQEEASAGSV